MSVPTFPVTPLQVWCPACFADPGQKCNAPTDTGRRDVSWFHMSRESRAQGTDDGYTFGDSGKREHA